MVSKMHIGVIGLGKFGLCFARNLHDLGQVVLGVDLDPDNIKQAQQFLSFVYQADDVLHKGDVLVVISHLDDLLKIKA